MGCVESVLALISGIDELSLIRSLSLPCLVDKVGLLRDEVLEAGLTSKERMK